MNTPAWARRFVEPPVLATEAETLTARTHHMVAWSTAGLGTAVLMLLAAAEPQTLARRALSSLIVVVSCLVTVEINRRGRTRLAGALFVGALVALVAWRAWTAGGLSAPLGFLFIVFVLLAGLLLGTRGAAVVAAVEIAFTLALALTEMFGALPAAQLTFSPLAVWAYSALAIGLALTLQRMALASLLRALHSLGERVKELRLLHAVARMLQPDRPAERALFQQLIERVPAAWQFPEVCEARLTVHSTVVQTARWRSSPWAQSIDFVAGDGPCQLEVVYLEQRPPAHEGPFLAEERTLLESLAEMLIGYLELREHREHLEALVATRTRELTVAKEEADRANRAKSTFLTTMSHEIRTPMNAILGHAQLLQRDGLEPAQHRQLDIILSSGDHLLALLNNVLEMSKIEAGRTTLAVAPFDLHALLDGVEAMFAALGAGRGLSLAFEGVRSVPRHVTGDAGRIRQVLINLLGNALKFTERGGVVVRAGSTSSPPGHRVTFEVSDTGAGIAPGELDRVFEVFEQAAGGAKAGGVGLGLAISRELARLMSGDLTVRSELGAGTTFTFTFEVGPAGDEGRASEPARELAALASQQRVPKVLVVDDDPQSLALAARLLRGVGFETREASRGEEALAIHDVWRPELVLMDVRMPGMGGLEALRQLRSRDSTVVLVAFTAGGLDSLSADARTAGADDVFLKPYKDGDLLRLVGDRLGLVYTDATQGPEEGLTRLFAKLPAPLLEQLRVAAIEARPAHLEVLAVQAEAHAPGVAEPIRALVRQFQYDKLLAALECSSSAPVE